MSRSLPEYMGVYKAMVLSNVVEPTKKSKLPQLKLRVFLTEFYDEKEGEWLDVSEEKYVMTAFLVLYDKEDNETMNHQQVCKVFGWDGCGFDLLCGDLEGHELQVRLKENEDNEKYPVEISWIDEIDADPQGGFKKASAEDIRDLNAQFSHLFKAKKAGAKKAAASAKPKKQTAAAKKKAAAAEEPTEEQTAGAEETEELTPAQKKAALLAKSNRLRKEEEKERAEAEKAGPPAKKKKKAAATKKKTAPADGDTMPDDFDKRSAWFTIAENRDPECNDEQMKAEWDAAIEELAPEGDEDLLDAEGWWKVKNAVLANIGKDA